MLTQREINVRDYINDEWFRPDAPKELWISCYQAISVKARSKSECVIRFDDMTCLLLSGRMKYIGGGEDPKFEQTSSGVKVHPQEAANEETFNGFWLVFLQPYQPIDVADSDLLWLPRQKEVCSLLSMIVSKNIVYKKIFDNVLNLETDEVAAFSNAYPMETPLRERLLDQSRIDECRDIDARIKKMAVPERNRTKLGLRWYHDAKNETGGKAFLQFWIAFEVVFMPKTSDIRPIKKLLAEAYEMSISETSSTFHIGRIYGLRNAIVHGGYSKPLSSDLLTLVDLLFQDVFLYKILGAKRGYARSYIENRKFSIVDLTNIDQDA